LNFEVEVEVFSVNLYYTIDSHSSLCNYINKSNLSYFSFMDAVDPIVSLKERALWSMERRFRNYRHHALIRPSSLGNGGWLVNLDKLGRRKRELMAKIQVMEHSEGLCEDEVARLRKVLARC
jgi:hypothetical protein